MSLQVHSASDCCCLKPAVEPYTSRTADGRVRFENENYQIFVNDTGEVKIFNKNTGENYRIWGDPHVDVDGKRAFDFWGQTTFQLEDGTKVTIETTPWRGNQDMTISSKVTITDGDYGVHITGVDDNHRGDLEFNEAEGLGGFMDFMIRDGNVIHENPAGKGFLAIDDNGHIRQVDQQFINETDELKSNQLAQQFTQIMDIYGGLISISFAGAFLSSLAELADQEPDPTPFTQPLIFTIARTMVDWLGN